MEEKKPKPAERRVPFIPFTIVVVESFTAFRGRWRKFTRGFHSRSLGLGHGHARTLVDKVGVVYAQRGRRRGRQHAGALQPRAAQQEPQPRPPRFQGDAK